MATLLPDSYEFPEIDFSDPDWMAKYDEAWEKFQAENESIAFPVADGSAVYRVESYDPPVLQHVAFGDCWQAHPALIRGLTSDEIRDMVEREKALRAIFSRDDSDTPIPEEE